MGKTREQSTSIDPRLTDAAVRNIERAEKAGKIPFVPNHGLRVAALSPKEMMARTMANQGAEAFGFAPAASGLPEPEEVGGFRGYSTGGLYDDTMEKSVPQNLQDYIASFFVDPNTVGTQPAPTPENGAGNTTPQQGYGDYNDYGDGDGRDPSAGVGWSGGGFDPFGWGS